MHTMLILFVARNCGGTPCVGGGAEITDGTIRFTQALEITQQLRVLTALQSTLIGFPAPMPHCLASTILTLAPGRSNTSDIPRHSHAQTHVQIHTHT